MPDEGIEEAEEIKPIFSKNKLKKIKRGGIADGKNKIYFDNDGQPITSLEYHMKHNTFTKDNQDQADKDDQDQETDYFDKVKKSLQANKNIDDQIANERVKQKRIKKRKQKEEYRKQLEQENQKEFYVVEGEDNDDDDDDNDEGED